jgi:ABC-type Fe3+-hydroxamate transport system substrate-binding protein
VRVVSLVPSATETLLAWGVTPVAVTRFCEQPHLAQVGGTKDPDLAAIVALAPDLVIVCEEENRLEDADVLTAAGLALCVLRIDSVSDVDPALDALASAVEVARPTTFDLPAPAAVSRTAFVPIWRRPWMSLSAGTYGSSVLEHLGIANVFAAAGDRYPEITLAEARDREPDVVLAPSEPYPFAERHVDELSVVAPVVLVDGQDLYGGGERTPAALARLAVALTA